MVLKRLALKSEIILLEARNFYICVKCKLINNIYSDINATIVNMETAKDINLESVISYATNTHSFHQHNFGCLELVKITYEVTLNKN
jgi:hypothetical protein